MKPPELTFVMVITRGGDGHLVEGGIRSPGDAAPDPEATRALVIGLQNWLRQYAPQRPFEVMAAVGRN